jgi:hypothetical protein
MACRRESPYNHSSADCRKLNTLPGSAACRHAALGRGALPGMEPFFCSCDLSGHGGAIMKKISGILLALWMGALLAGCAIDPIPKGSQPLATFKGILRGNVYDGPIQVTLFETQEGDTIFTGHFMDTIAGGEYYFRGTVKGYQMEGRISLVFGTIAGELSPDHTRMSGTFRLAQNHGTWSADRQ